MNPRSPRVASASSVRWWPLVPIALLGGGLLYAIQVEGWSVVRPARDFTVVVGVIDLAIYIWIRAWSRLRQTAQIVIVGILVAVQAGLFSMFRLDEFAGDGRIIWKWRWWPTPEQRLIDFSLQPKQRTSLANLAVTSEADSPSFRGLDRTGQYRFPDLDLNWTEHPPRELWRHPVGRGWSSFAVVGEFCVTQEQRGQFEAVVCYKLSTGNEVWQHLDETRFDEVTSGPGPRATPAIQDGRVYSLGATGILNCLEGADGHTVWSRKMQNETVPLFGYASSPFIHGPMLYITPSDVAGSILAVDRETGKTVWSQGARKPGYSSPVLFPTGKEDQVLVFDAMGVYASEALTGEARWNFRWGDNSDDQVNVCVPAIVSLTTTGQLEIAKPLELLISSGYGRGSALLAVTETRSGGWTAQSIWQTKALKSKFSDVIIHNGHAYGLDEGILTCISLTDGTRRWKNGRYGYGQLILVNEMLLIQTESGRIALVKADPAKFTEAATLEALNDRTWNQPVVAGRHLLVRNDREAICFELPRVPAEASRHPWQP